LNLAPIHNFSEVRRCALNQRRGAADFHGLFHPAQLKREIHPRSLGDIDSDVVGDRLSEPWCGNRDLVSPGRK
jgi:hypothetical protein